MNCDGQFTIRDVFNWVWQLLDLPGSLALYYFEQEAPNASRFLEMSPDSLLWQFVSIAVSLIVWFFAILLTVLVVSGVAKEMRGPWTWRGVEKAALRKAEAERKAMGYKQ
jgi:hypothetical protein